MSIFKSLIIALLFISANAQAVCSKTPEEALYGLLAAYKSKDVEKAAEFFDFVEWASFQTLQTGVEISPEELEIAYKKSLEKNGFPDYSNVTCSVEQSYSNGLVLVEEICKYGNEVSTKTQLIAVKVTCGWKLAGPMLPNNNSQLTR